jgi:hypothetical protein
MLQAMRIYCFGLGLKPVLMIMSCLVFTVEGLELYAEVVEDAIARPGM